MRISDWSSDVCSSDLIEHALASGAVSLHAKVKARYHTVDADNKPIRLVVDTTPGRMLLSEVLPRHPKVPFSLLNKVLTKKEITELIDIVYRHCRSEEHTSELQSLMRISYAVFCLNKQRQENTK